MLVKFKIFVFVFSHRYIYGGSPLSANNRVTVKMEVVKMLTMPAPILDKSLYTAKKSGDSKTRVTVKLLSRQSYRHPQTSTFSPPISQADRYPTYTHRSGCRATWSECGGIGIGRKLPLTEQYRRRKYEMEQSHRHCIRYLFSNFLQNLKRLLLYSFLYLLLIISIQILQKHS